MELTSKCRVLCGTSRRCISRSPHRPQKPAVDFTKRTEMEDITQTGPHKPAAMGIDYSAFVNAMSKRRKPSMLREITHVMSKMPPETISFAVGIPNSNTFPFKEIQVELKTGEVFKINGKMLDAALQYLPSRGYPPLLDSLRKMQDRAHGAQDWTRQSLLVTTGGQEALCNTLEMCLNEGDTVIIQHPVYPGAADLMSPYNPHYLAIEQDQHGVQPQLLQRELERCLEEGRPLPKLMYVNPTSSNPCGVCLTTERKKEIYNLACQYNFLILEDDSYYHLHFLEEDPRSFLSMDTEGRVLRFDSFSKIMSSGLRIGYITGPEPLLRNIELHLQVSTLHTSALSQVLVHSLLEEWGQERLLSHYKDVQKFYKKKRDMLIAACERHLGDLADWNIPMGGMFLWLRLNLPDTYTLAMKRCIENCLLIVPGHPFTVNNYGSQQCPYIRLSYSLASPEDMEEGCKRLAAAIREEQRLQNRTTQLLD